MAEALFRQALHDRDAGIIRVESAGLNAVVNCPPCVEAQHLMFARGIDISSHRARQLTEKLINGADLILVMDMEQKKRIEAKTPSSRGKVYCLGVWGNFEVPDPIGQSESVFEHVLQLIEKGVADWIPKLKRG